MTPLVLRMKKLILNLVLLSALFSHALTAAPILSDDGSKLTGLELDDKLYDVMFANGVVPEVYGDVVFNDEWQAEANLVSAGLFDYFLENRVLPQRIAGCTIIPICYLFLPDELVPGDYPWRDNGFVYLTPEAPYVTMSWGAISTFKDWDSTPRPLVTLVTFEVRTVSAPPVAMLVALGILLLRWKRSRLS